MCTGRGPRRQQQSLEGRSKKTIEDSAEVGEETPRAKRAAARNEVVVGEETPRAKRAAARNEVVVGEKTPRAKRTTAREAKAVAEAAGVTRESIAQPPCLALVPVAASMEVAPPCQRFVATIDLTKNHKYKSNYLFNVGGWTWRNRCHWR